MAFGDSPFVSTPAAAPVLPQLQPMVEVRVGDDWPFQFNVTDPAGRPIDLTGMVVNSPIGGATVGAELFGTLVANPAVIAGANGSLQIVDAVNGVVSGVVSRSLTSLVPPQSPNAAASPVRLSVFIIDTLWRKHTFPPIVLLPLRPQDIAILPTQPQQITLTMGVQGPAGASSSLTADQIAALDTATLQSAEAYTDQQIAALPDTATVANQIATGLIRAALVAYATKSDVAGAVEAATAGLVTEADVTAAIQAYFAQQTFAPTGDALNALIDARVVAYLQRTANLIGTVQVPANMTGALSRDVMLSGSVVANDTMTGAMDRQFALAGSVVAQDSLSGIPTITVPASGTIPASAAAIGALTTQAPGSLALAGASPSTASMTASPSYSLFLAGAVPASAALIGATTNSLSLAGSSPSTASMTAAASRSNDPSGTVSALAIMTGNLGYAVILNGAAISGASMTGLMTKALGVAGSTPASAGMTGTLSAVNNNRSPIFAFGLLGAAA